MKTKPLSEIKTCRRAAAAAAVVAAAVRTNLFREKPGAVAAAVYRVVAVRRAVPEVELDALLEHAAEELVFAVLGHR